MKPKDKAIELVDKFYNYVNCWDDDGNANYQQAKNNAKQCALIAVDEVLEECLQLKVEYWEQVKEEIENI